MNNFRDLKVWHKSIDLAVEVYKVTSALPASEKFNLVSQMQRAAVSIPSNIAEGCGRHCDPAFDNFLSISLGSSYNWRLRRLSVNVWDSLQNQSIQ